MARPYTRGRSCTGKTPHRLKTAAVRQMHDLLRAGSVRLQVYRCRFCGYFHVGHKRRYRGQR